MTSATGPAVERRRFEPPVTETSQPFWDATRERRLVLQWCAACDRPVWYPRDFCPSCATSPPGPGAASGLVWREASGRGVVYAFTIESRPALPKVFGEEPFVVALVELAEGPRLMANVIGCEPGAVRVGMPVQVEWEALSDGRHLPLFAPAAPSAPRS
jgi:uncharacterized OB-fold protein